MSSLAVVLLCGGEGKRLGGEIKPLLSKKDGRTILESLEDELENLGKIYVVVPESLRERFERSSRFPILIDPGLGPAHALFSAAKAISEEWMFLVGGDQPNMRSELARALFSRRQKDDVCVIAKVGGALQTLGAFYERAALMGMKPPLPDSLKKLVSGLAPVSIAEGLSAEEEAGFKSLNTWADAAELGVSDPRS